MLIILGNQVVMVVMVVLSSQLLQMKHLELQP